MSKTRIIDLSKIVKIRKFPDAVVFYEKNDYYVCEPTTKLPDRSEGYVEITLKKEKHEK